MEEEVKTGIIIWSEGDFEYKVKELEDSPSGLWRRLGKAVGE